MLVVASSYHVITMDLHTSQIQGFFNIPVDNLRSEPLMINYFKCRIPGWEDGIIDDSLSVLMLGVPSGTFASPFTSVPTPLVDVLVIFLTKCGNLGGQCQG